MISTFKVRLKGHKFDLKRASEYFNTDIFTISEIEDEYFISSDTFKDTRDTNVVISLAGPFIEKVNAILKLKFHGFKPIELDNLLVFEDENGISKIGAMRGKAFLRFEASINQHKTDLEIENHKIQTENLLNNVAASEVFHFYSQPTSWLNLYKIYEIIKDEIGESKIIGFLTRTELNRFTGTAQSKNQIGDAARHASKKYKGHPRPMTIQEADDIIKKLIFNWLGPAI